MRTYDSNETRALKWLRKQKYIHSSDAIGNGDVAGWKLVEKFPIEKIVHDVTNYPNQISMMEVDYMLKDFYPFGFYPIRLNKDYLLVDGQHRLKVAEICGFEFIDVWIE